MVSSFLLRQKRDDPFKRPVDGKGGSVNWESALIGHRLIPIIVKAAISDLFSVLC